MRQGSDLPVAMEGSLGTRCHARCAPRGAVTPRGPNGNCGPGAGYANKVYAFDVPATGNTPGGVEWACIGGNSFNNRDSHAVIPWQRRFVRGDSSGNASVNLQDALLTLQHIFSGGALPCVSAADCDANGSVNLSDAVLLLGYLYAGYPAPNQSFGVCTPLYTALPCQNPACP